MRVSADVPAISAARRVAAWALMGYAIVLYPVLLIWSGHVYPAAPTFGVTPCPLTIFTFGMLLLLQDLRWSTLVVPLGWSVIGGSAAFLLGVYPDLMLPVAGVATASVHLLQRRP